MEFTKKVVKACFLFSLDKTTETAIENIVTKTEERHPKLVKRLVKNGSLPYHMTIYGGAKFKGEVYESEIRDVASQLRPFQDIKYIPKVRDIEIATTNNSYLVIRLKFYETLPYVITGDRAKNVDIALQICPKFELDEIRHISSCRVLGGDDEIDIVKPYFRLHATQWRSCLLQMQLTPQVWIKKENVWEKFVL